MPRPSQEAIILQAALHCFAERGYDATRIRHIAARAAVSEGALYRHYPSLEALAQTLYAQHLGVFAAQLQRIAAMDTAVTARLRAVIEFGLASYRANPAAFTFVLLRQATFMPQLPPDTVFPIDIIAGLVAAGQRDQMLRAGQPNVLAAILLGCLLRPIIVSQLAQPGALDLLGDVVHDQVIIDAALAALVRPT